MVLDRSVPPEFSLPESFKLIEATLVELDNGLKVHYINGGTQEVLRLELIFKAGTKYEQAFGASYFGSKMLFEGTTHRTSAQIFEYLDQYGAFYELGQNADHLSITCFTLSRYLKEIVEILAEILKSANFPEKELVDLRNIASQNHKINLSKTSYLASVNFRKKLFGADHPYGRYISENEIAGITRNELQDFFTSNLLEKSFDIVLSGRLENDSIQILNEGFGHLHYEAVSVLKINNILKSNLSFEEIERPESVQTSVKMGKLSIQKGHSDYFALVITNEILGGYFGSRLMKNIREDKGYTYGIYSSLSNFQDCSYWAIGADVKKEFTQNTLDEIQKEIAELQSSHVPEEELLNVKNYLKGSFLSSINSPFSIADKFKGVYFHGLGYDFYNKYYRAIGETSQKDIKEMALKYLGTSDVTTVIAGGLK